MATEVPRLAKRGVDARQEVDIAALEEDVTGLEGEIEDIIDGTTATGDALLARAATVAYGVAHSSGENILIATLTTAFGDPATLADGSIFTFEDTTTNKAYIVIVVGHAFLLGEMTAAAAE